jgi:hypothetical protein
MQGQAGKTALIFFGAGPRRPVLFDSAVFPAQRRLSSGLINLPALFQSVRFQAKSNHPGYPRHERSCMIGTLLETPGSKQPCWNGLQAIK